MSFRGRECKRMGFIVVLVWFILMGSATGILAGKVENFSAVQVMMDPSGKIVSEGNLYVRSDRVRMETQLPSGDGSMVIIFRKDLKRHWMLNPSEKKYFERPYDEKEMENTFKKMSADKVEKTLGTEKVNGVKCKKVEIENTFKMMGFSRKVRSIAWISDQYDFPLRTRSEDGSMTELRKINRSKPAKSYFELPKDYLPVSNIMELYAGDRGQGQGQQQSGEKSGMPFKLPKFKNPFGK